MASNSSGGKSIGCDDTQFAMATEDQKTRVWRAVWVACNGEIEKCLEKLANTYDPDRGPDGTLPPFAVRLIGGGDYTTIQIDPITEPEGRMEREACVAMCPKGRFVALFDVPDGECVTTLPFTCDSP